MIQERQSDTKIKYIYVKKFSYHIPDVAESFAGHPHSGKIYRSIFNIHTGHHRLLLPHPVVLGFNELVGISDMADFELIEITLDNILDFDLTEENLDVFLKPDTDIIFEPQQMIQNAMAQHEQEETDFAHRASGTIMDLWSINPMKAEILLSIAHCLTEVEMTSHEDPANNLRYTSRGLGVNIAEALRSINRYSCDNKKINEDTSDLMVAIESLVVEIERNYNNE